MRNALDFNLPPSISILINFGLYSKMIMYRYIGETGGGNPIYYFAKEKTKSCVESLLELLYPFCFATQFCQSRTLQYNSINLISLLKSAFFTINALSEFVGNRLLLSYSAVNAIHGCTDEQLWDPFSLVCRDVYCATGFDLVNFQVGWMTESSLHNS